MKYSHILGIIIFLFGITSCKEEKKIDIKTIEVSYDLERFTGNKFESENGPEISGANNKTNKYARSGEYSVELYSEKKQYALAYSYSPLELGDEVIVSIWRRKNKQNFGKLYVSAGGKGKTINKSVISEGDWELLEKRIKISRELSDDQLKIYVWNNKSQKVYFDDLNIKIIKNGGYTLVNHPDLEQVEFNISPKNFNQILIKRDEALKTRILISNNGDWVKANINWNGDTEKCKIRLKGDWTDHLIGQKWSFRINISNSKKANGYSRFSIQNPLSRNYISEWLTHQIFFEENVLTTRYDFINLKINNDIKGLFSLEEHFTGELLTAQNRKEGVILKFDEDPLWQFRSEKHPKNDGHPIWFQSAEIIPFGLKNILNDDKLYQEYLTARDLLHRFQFSSANIDQIFDLDKMARFIALIDVFNAYHGLIWHNLRFYYNSETSKLEPIAYDLFTDFDPEDEYVPGFMGLNFLNNKYIGSYYQFRLLFTSNKFIKKYIEYLNKYTSEGFLKNQIILNEAKLEFYEKEIQKEYLFYHFDSTFYVNNAQKIREKLPEFEVNSFKLLDMNINKGGTINTKKYKFGPVKNASLKSYVSIQNNKAIIQLRNFYYKPLIIKGYIVATDTLYSDFKIKLNAYKHKNIIETKEITSEFLIDEVIYQVVDEDSLYFQNVIQYRAPQ